MRAAEESRTPNQSGSAAGSDDAPAGEPTSGPDSVAPRGVEPLAWNEESDALLRSFLDEDVQSGDVTSEPLVGLELAGRGRLRVKEDGVLCGLAVFARVFALLDRDARVRFAARDGQAIAPGDIVCHVEAPARVLLIGERTALNLIQRMSGIATLSRHFVDAARAGASAGQKHPTACVVDTRKTTPGLRAFEKYAVRCGGAQNHRFGLYDEAMIKNNHVDATGDDLTRLVERLREVHGPGLVIHAEARDADEAFAAVRGRANVVLLDNMDVARMAALVPELRSLADELGHSFAIEASGGVNLDTIGRIANCGVDRVSVGALTHSATGLDLSFGIEVGRV